MARTSIPLPDGLDAFEVTVANTETAIAPFDNDAVERVILNTGTNDVFVGPTGVTTATGFPVASGAALTVTGMQAIFGIVAAGTETVRVLETRDV